MKQPTFSPMPHDLIGRKIAARLALGCTDMEHDIAERLRVARQQALARRKLVDSVPASGMAVSGSVASLHFGGDDAPGWWARLASVLPLLALVAGLLTIYVVQNENRANEVAEVDAALLTDDLPTAAYTDPGFLQFLTTGPAAQP